MIDVPLIDLQAQYRELKPAIERRLGAVLESGRFVLGPEVAELEAELAHRAGAADVIAVGSGTDALMMALMALGIGPGDAVFVPAFTFTATAEAVRLVGAAPVIVDVEARSLNMDPADLERRIARTRAAGRLRPKAAIAVDLFGRPADYPAIQATAEAQGLALIADAAQSFGARLGDRPVGCLAPLTAISFYPSKPLGAYGDAGAIAVTDPAFGAVLRSLRVHGETVDDDDHVRIGLNARIDTLQAAVLLAKLELFDRELERRRRIAALYNAELGDLVETPEIGNDWAGAWAQYTVQVADRDRVRQALAAAGIATGVYYGRPIHLQSAYRADGEGEGSLPVSEAASRRVLSLPMHGHLDDATALRVAGALRDAVAGGASRRSAGA